MDALIKLSSVMGLSLTSGINLYATVAVVGFATKSDMIKGLPPEFKAFDNNLVIAIATILYLCEFAADKIPAFDSMWDSVHTIIRPFGAALISLTVVGDAAPPVEVVAGLLGASLAMGTHAAKAGTRLVVNTSPEPFSNVAVSLAEDVGVVGMVILVMAHPYISLVISLIVLLLLIRFGPGLWRGALLIFKAIPIRLFSAFSGKKDPELKESLPDSFEELVDEEISRDEKILAALKCYSQKVKGCGRNRKGYLIFTDQALLFAFRRLFKNRIKKWKIRELEKSRLQKRFLFDVFGIKIEGKFARFIFLKNRSAAAGQLADIFEQTIGEPESVAPAEAVADPESPSP